MPDNWKNNLNSFFDETDGENGAPELSEFGQFIATTVIPAFEEVAEELQKHGRYVVIRNTEASAVLVINHKGEEELSYRIQGRVFPSSMLPYAEIRFRERKGPRIITVEDMIRRGPANYKLSDVTTEEIVQDIVARYTKRVPQKD